MALPKIGNHINMASGSPTGKELPMRLALRVEGEMWNAYVASPHSMDGARLIGSIALVAVERSDKRKQAFMDLMQDFLSDVITEVAGSKPDWSQPRQAPESERSNVTSEGGFDE